MTINTASPGAAPTRLLRVKQVSERIGLSKSRIYGLVTEGLFPAPVRLNPSVSRSATAWLDAEIDEWIAARVAERDLPGKHSRAGSSSRIAAG